MAVLAVASLEIHPAGVGGVSMKITEKKVCIKTPLTSVPNSCAECIYGERYGLVGEVMCRVLGEYFTGNIKPPHKERPDECPMFEVEVRV